MKIKKPAGHPAGYVFAVDCGRLGGLKPPALFHALEPPLLCIPLLAAKLDGGFLIKTPLFQLTQQATLLDLPLQYL
jgi:hypothetical protein